MLRFLSVAVGLMLISTGIDWLQPVGLVFVMIIVIPAMFKGINI